MFFRCVRNDDECTMHSNVKHVRLFNVINKRRDNMWTKPEVTEMRFGFEVTMYVCNR